MKIINTTPVVTGVPGEEGSTGLISNIGHLVNSSQESSQSNVDLSQYSGKEAMITQLLQQSDSPQDAASLLRQLAQEDPAYMELYVQLLAERENQERAYQWYEDFNSKYYQRTSKDLEAAGLNPWLALQSLGSSGSGSLSPAGSWSGTTGSTASQKQKELQAQTGQKVIGAAATVIAAVIGALVMALL